MRALAWSAAVAILLSSGASARAQVDDESRERQMRSLEEMRERAAGRNGRRSADDDRHTGGYFRIDALGVGRESFSGSPFVLVSGASLLAVPRTTFSGLGGSLGVHFGHAVERGTILGVHLYASAAADPKMSVQGQSSSTTDTTLILLGAGPELTFYFMPSNVYVTSSFLLTTVRSSVAGTSEYSEAGLGAYLALGKEWWVTRRWGVGLAAHVAFASNKDKGDYGKDFEPTIRSTSLGVALSATYN